ncbi:hypothetical protein E4U54_006485, partial [Claviceps lovelessii]
YGTRSLVRDLSIVESHFSVQKRPRAASSAPIESMSRAQLGITVCTRLATGRQTPRRTSTGTSTSKHKHKHKSRTYVSNIPAWKRGKLDHDAEPT